MQMRPRWITFLWQSQYPEKKYVEFLGSVKCLRTAGPMSTELISSSMISAFELFGLILVWKPLVMIDIWLRKSSDFFLVILRLSMRIAWR